MNARLPGIVVPNGFTIPFYYYDEFLRANKLDDAIYTLLNDQKFVHDPAYRREKLVDLRETHQAGASLMNKLRAQILAPGEVGVSREGFVCAQLFQLGRLAKLQRSRTLHDRSERSRR